MECITASYAPVILQPDSEHDWANQHVLSEQLRQAENKQPLKTHTSVLVQPRRQQRPGQQLPPTSSSRRSSNLLLHIPKPTGRVSKLITPTKNAKSPQEWEALLRTAVTDLHGAYASMLQVPAAPKPQPTLPSSRRPDFSGLDRVQMASRAMQMAAGFGCAARREQSEEYDGGESSGSEADVDAPATPVSVETGEMMDIDPRLFS
ncbi:unnamed protein product [Discula destructiva]